MKNSEHYLLTVDLASGPHTTTAVDKTSAVVIAQFEEQPPDEHGADEKNEWPKLIDLVPEFVLDRDEPAEHCKFLYSYELTTQCFDGLVFVVTEPRAPLKNVATPHRQGR